MSLAAVPAALAAAQDASLVDAGFSDLYATQEPARGALAALAVTLGDVSGAGVRSVFVGSSGGLFALANSGSDAAPALTPTVNTPLWTSAAVLPALGDLTGDGLDDALLGASDGSLALLVNDGAGGFAEAAAAWLPSFSEAAAPAIGDVDGDGLADVAFGAADGSVSLFVNAGGGNVSAADAFALSAETAVAAGSARPAVCEGGDVYVGGDDGVLRLFANASLTPVDAAAGSGFAPACAYAFGGVAQGLVVGSPTDNPAWLALAAAPDAPGDVAAEAAGDGAVLVQWAAPASSNGAPVSEYVVTAGNETSVVVDASELSVTLTSVPAPQSVTPTVVARNAAGDSAAATCAAAVDVTLGVPVAPAPACALSGTTVVVSWEAPGDGGSPLTGYELSGVELDASATSYVVTGVDSGASVFVELQAANAEGLSASAGRCNVTDAAYPAVLSAVSAVNDDALFPNGAVFPANWEDQQVPVLADVDGDGDRDLWMFSPYDGAFTVLYDNAGSDAAPLFVPVLRHALSELQPEFASFGDLNGDGAVDALVTAAGGSLALYWGPDFSATAAEGELLFVHESAHGGWTALGDTDGDGDLDLVLGSELYENTGTATWASFAPAASLPLLAHGGGSAVPSLCDADGDGDVDLLGSWLPSGLLVVPDVTDEAAAFSNEAALGPAGCAPGMAGRAVGAVLNDVVTSDLNFAVRWLGLVGTRPSAVAAAPTVTAVGTASATLEWAAPADDGGVAVTQYSILVYNDEDPQYVVAAAGSPWTVVSLPETATTFAVRAESPAGVGVESPQSADAVTPPSGAPPDAPIITECSGDEEALYVAYSVERADVNNGGDVGADTVALSVRAGTTLVMPLPFGGRRRLLGDDLLQPTAYADVSYNVSLVFQTDEGESPAATCEAVPYRSVWAASPPSVLELEGEFADPWLPQPCAADLTGDGVVDLFVGGGSPQLWINGTTLAASNPLEGLVAPESHVAFGDLDGDGDADALNCTSALGCQLLLNNGGSGFMGAGQVDSVAVPLGLTGVALADVRGVGAPDLFMAYQGVVAQWRNLGLSSFELVAGWNADAIFGELFVDNADYVSADVLSVSFCDLDGDGLLDASLGAARSSSVLLNNGDGTFFVSRHSGSTSVSEGGGAVCLDGVGGAPAGWYNGLEGTTGQLEVYAAAQVPTQPKVTLSTALDDGDSVTVGWSAPLHEGSAPVDGFQVTVNFWDGTDDAWSVVSDALDADARSVTLTSPQAGATTAQATVVATNVYGASCEAAGSLVAFVGGGGGGGGGGGSSSTVTSATIEAVVGGALCAVLALVAVYRYGLRIQRAGGAGGGAGGQVLGMSPRGTYQPPSVGGGGGGAYQRL